MFFSSVISEVIQLFKKKNVENERCKLEEEKKNFITIVNLLEPAQSTPNVFTKCPAGFQFFPFSLWARRAVAKGI